MLVPAAILGAIGTIGIIIVYAYVGIQVGGVLWEQRETMKTNAENVVKAVDVIVDEIPTICGLEDHITSQLSENWVNYLENEQARYFAQRILDGEKLSTCEWHNFIDHLNEWEKRKLRIYDLVCDLSACL